MDDDDKVEKLGENLSKVNLPGLLFFISKAGIALIRFRKAFTKVLILYHFNLKYYIQIETDTSGFVMSGIFCELTLGHMTNTNPDVSHFKIG